MARGFDEGALLAERYRLERILGTGGMASVWLARDQRLGRPVAVKLLSDTLAHDESYLTRFRREAHIAAGLSHPNLVQVYDFGGEHERPYLVMEYVPGETLAGRITEGSALEFDPGRLARELLGALDYIHSAGIVHRDIKPANVLIAPDASAKLTDFGIAQPEAATRLTSTGLVIGTRNYIAPEVLRGEAATPRSDLYSCAMVLREAFDDTLPADLAGLVGRLGDQDPARRPQTASRALASLAASGAASDPGQTETAPTAPLPPDRTTPTIPTGAATARTQPRRWLLGGGLALLAALLVAGIMLLSGGDEASSPGGGRSGDVLGAERGGASTENPGATETVTETVPTESEETLEPTAPPGKSKKVKPPKEDNSPRGKAKGLRKH
jgi:eukaryotic-like serine/threonine-protein kinase